MARYTYERLSGQDNDFLVWETPSLPMHVGGTLIFDAGALLEEDGGIDFESIKRLTRSILHRIPRYRQKLVWIPGKDHAVWVDDPHFNLDYHFRHTSLPRPGTVEQLKRLTARVMGHALDRSRPLWETWVVEGLEGGRFAMINKIHHCMLDGEGGVDLSQILLSPKPDAMIREAPPYIPRPIPSEAELRIDDWWRRLGVPLEVASGIADFVRETPNLIDELLTRSSALASLASWKAVSASETPINRKVGPHRAVDWRVFPLAQMKAVRKALGCTINDVVLTTVTGAIREIMLSRQVRPEDLEFRVSTPVNVRQEQDRGKMGNHVSSWVIRLPLEEANPTEQLEIIRDTTIGLKRSNQAVAIEMVTKVLEWLPINLQAAASGTINMIVTNVPGPPFPLYILGAKMLDIIPLPPLLENVGLVVGVLSYNGQVYWGFNADYDQLPDLDIFAEALEAAFSRLAQTVGVDLHSIEEDDSVGARPPEDAGEVVQNWQHPVSPSAANRPAGGQDGLST